MSRAPTNRAHRGLRAVMTIDGWMSFTAPPLMLLGIPALVILDVPGWLLATVVLALAAVLGACGIAMAGLLAMEVVRGRWEFPTESLAGVGGADWDQAVSR